MDIKNSTTACSESGHLEFDIQFDPEYVLQMDVDSFISHLIDRVKNGEKFEPGHLIQVGWMMIRIEKREGKLALFEPDFIEFPIHFVPGVTNTFRHLRFQKSTAESAGLEKLVDFPTIFETGIVCSKHEDSVDFVMERASSDKKDSGWFVGCNDPKHDHNNPTNLQRMSLYQLAYLKPTCIPFLALPMDSFVRMKGNTIEILYKKQKLQIKDDSFLAHSVKQTPVAGLWQTYRADRKE